jgi:hypothetical protein
VGDHGRRQATRSPREEEPRNRRRAGKGENPGGDKTQESIGAPHPLETAEGADGLRQRSKTLKTDGDERERRAVNGTRVEIADEAKRLLRREKL